MNIQEALTFDPNNADDQTKRAMAREAATAAAQMNGTVPAHMTTAEAIAWLAQRQSNAETALAALIQADRAADTVVADAVAHVDSFEARISLLEGAPKGRSK